MLCSIAKLEEKDIETIKSLEAKVGKTLLAFGCHDIKPAQLSDEQLTVLQGEEKKLGMSLVAVE